MNEAAKSPRRINFFKHENISCAEAVETTVWVGHSIEGAPCPDDSLFEFITVRSVQDGGIIGKMHVKQRKEFPTIMSYVAKLSKEKQSQSKLASVTEGVVWVGTSTGSMYIFSATERNLLVEHIDIHFQEITCCTRVTGSMFSGAKDCIIVQWDITSGEVIRSITGHTSPITALLGTPNGKWLYSSSMDMSVRVWNIETGVLKQKISITNSPVVNLLIKDYSLWMATQDNSIQIWDIKSILVEHKKSNKGTIRLVLLTSSILSISDEVCIWNPQNLKLLRKYSSLHSFPLKGVVKIAKADLFKIWSFDKQNLNIFEEQSAFNYILPSEEGELERVMEQNSLLTSRLHSFEIIVQDLLRDSPATIIDSLSEGDLNTLLSIAGKSKLELLAGNRKLRLENNQLHENIGDFLNSQRNAPELRNQNIVNVQLHLKNTELRSKLEKLQYEKSTMQLEFDAKREKLACEKVELEEKLVTTQWRMDEAVSNCQILVEQLKTKEQLLSQFYQIISPNPTTLIASTMHDELQAQLHEKEQKNKSLENENFKLIYQGKLIDAQLEKIKYLFSNFWGKGEVDYPQEISFTRTNFHNTSIEFQIEHLFSVTTKALQTMKQLKEKNESVQSKISLLEEKKIDLELKLEDANKKHRITFTELDSWKVKFQLVKEQGEKQTEVIRQYFETMIQKCEYILNSIFVNSKGQLNPPMKQVNNTILVRESDSIDELMRCFPSILDDILLEINNILQLQEKETSSVESESELKEVINHLDKESAQWLLLLENVSVTEANDFMCSKFNAHPLVLIVQTTCNRSLHIFKQKLCNEIEKNNVCEHQNLVLQQQIEMMQNHWQTACNHSYYQDKHEFEQLQLLLQETNGCIDNVVTENSGLLQFTDDLQKTISQQDTTIIGLTTMNTQYEHNIETLHNEILEQRSSIQQQQETIRQLELANESQVQKNQDMSTKNDEIVELNRKYSSEIGNYILKCEQYENQIKEQHQANELQQQLSEEFNLKFSDLKQDSDLFGELLEHTKKKYEDLLIQNDLQQKYQTSMESNFEQCQQQLKFTEELLNDTRQELDNSTRRCEDLEFIVNSIKEQLLEKDEQVLSLKQQNLDLGQQIQLLSKELSSSHQLVDAECEKNNELVITIVEHQKQGSEYESLRSKCEFQEQQITKLTNQISLLNKSVKQYENIHGQLDSAISLVGDNSKLILANASLINENSQLKLDIQRQQELNVSVVQRLEKEIEVNSPNIHLIETLKQNTSRLTEENCKLLNIIDQQREQLEIFRKENTNNVLEVGELKDNANEQDQHITIGNREELNEKKENLLQKPIIKEGSMINNLIVEIDDSKAQIFQLKSQLDSISSIHNNEIQGLFSQIDAYKSELQKSKGTCNELEEKIRIQENFYCTLFVKQKPEIEKANESRVLERQAMIDETTVEQIKPQENCDIQKKILHETPSVDQNSHTLNLSSKEIEELVQAFDNQTVELQRAISQSRQEELLHNTTQQELSNLSLQLKQKITEINSQKVIAELLQTRITELEHESKQHGDNSTMNTLNFQQTEQRNSILKEENKVAQTMIRQLQNDNDALRKCLNEAEIKLVETTQQVHVFQQAIGGLENVSPALNEKETITQVLYEELEKKNNDLQTTQLKLIEQTNRTHELYDAFNENLKKNEKLSADNLRLTKRVKEKEDQVRTQLDNINSMVKEITVLQQHAMGQERKLQDKVQTLEGEVTNSHYELNFIKSTLLAFILEIEAKRQELGEISSLGAIPHDISISEGFEILKRIVTEKIDLLCQTLAKQKEYSEEIKIIHEATFSIAQDFKSCEIDSGLEEMNSLSDIVCSIRKILERKQEQIDMLISESQFLSRHLNDTRSLIRTVWKIAEQIEVNADEMELDDDVRILVVKAQESDDEILIGAAQACVRIQYAISTTSSLKLENDSLHKVLLEDKEIHDQPSVKSDLWKKKYSDLSVQLRKTQGANSKLNERVESLEESAKSLQNTELAKKAQRLQSELAAKNNEVENLQKAHSQLQQQIRSSSKPTTKSPGSKLSQYSGSIIVESTLFKKLKATQEQLESLQEQVKEKELEIERLRREASNKKKANNVENN